MNALPPVLLNSLQAEIDPAFAARARFILEDIAKRKPKRILDAGCGRGYYVQALSYREGIQEIHGIDLNKEYVETAQKSMSSSRRRGSSAPQLEVASIYSLPYPDGYFDYVIASEILEHLDDDAKALKELHRVLKPGGIVAVTVPNRHFPFLWDPLNWILMKFGTHVPKHIWWLAGIWADHERLYTTQEITQGVKKNTFKILSTKTFTSHCWLLSHFMLYGVGKNIVERFGADSFNRFDFTREKPLSTLLARFMAWPSKTFDRGDEAVSVDIGVIAQKV